MTNDINLLNISAIYQAKMNTTPYQWKLIKNTFSSKEYAQNLRDTFPKEGFKHFQRNVGNKCHDFYGRCLVDSYVENASAIKIDSLPNIWNELIGELLSDTYRISMSRVNEVSLNGLKIEITCWRHLYGCFIAPHTDKPEKVLSHLFYFNEENWKPSDGGCLRILRNSDIENYTAEILPSVDTSVCFVRSDSSWHGTKPICNPNKTRLALQVVFFKENMRYTTGYK
jgi:SM-20-related protein